MAEAVVSFVVERLGVLLIQEAVVLHGVRKQVERLQTELKRMQCFLKDADAKQDEDERVRHWVSEIRVVAYDVEDVIDTFILKVEEERSKRGFMVKVKRYARIFSKGTNIYKISKEIKAIQTRISDISTSRETYGIRNIGEGQGEGTMSLERERLRRLRRSFPFADEEQIVGLEDDVRKLVEQLVKEELRCCVISIVGMGGLGKTTVAKKVYNCDDVKCHFGYRAWVCVSEEYRAKDILQRIIKSMKVPTQEELELMDRMTEEDLELHLHNLLEQRRYLVVIDDIWHEEAWESLRRALPDRKNGSRVLLTTRNRKVALYADERSLPHELQFLSNENSWELFCKKAFPADVVGTSSSCLPPGLERLGREMVGKCGGLPLAIIVLGGLLSRKLPHEWQRVLDHIGRHLLMKEQNQLSSILALSYNDLPYQLKSCFLYVSLFPEDFVIDTRKLIRLWVAEGFIPQGEETMEDVAEDYLNELIDRSLIQVAGRSWERMVHSCRIHDVLREFSISKAKGECFFDIYDGSIKSLPSRSSKSCRNATYIVSGRYVLPDYFNPHLRSLFFFNLGQNYLAEEQYPGLKLLRVLDL